MLESLRNASTNPIGKVVMSVFFGLIIISFGFWGIGDMLRGSASNRAATVGDQVISGDQFRAAFQRQVNQYAQMLKQPITGKQALAMGVDKAVLQRLEDDAALDSRAKALGLSLGEADIVKMVQADPNFTDANGQFNRANFEEILRQAGLSEAGFFAQQRALYARRQIQSALGGGAVAPKALAEALARLDGQTRSVDTLVLPASAAGDIAAPSDADFAKFFEAHKASYRANEYRALTIVEASPEALAKPGEVSEDEAKALYEKAKAQRFTVPPSRRIEQIVFPAQADADAAAAKIKGGASFEDVAKERGLGPKDIDLGVIAQGDPTLDKPVADAAFALADGAVSDAVKGAFGFAVVRVSQIVPGGVKPFETVAADLKKEIAVKRASEDVALMHDKIEDSRTAGKSLADAAKGAGLESKAFAAVDAAGLDKAGAKVEFLAAAAAVKAAFASDVNADDPPLPSKGGGFTWFDVTKIEAAHDRTLEEAKEKVLADFRADAVKKALAAKADDIVRQLRDGGDFAKIAAGLGLEKTSTAGIKRSGAAGLSAPLVAAVFQGPPAGAGSVAEGDGRIVFKVTADASPAVDFTSPDLVKAVKSLGDAFGAEIVAQYVGAVKSELGVHVDQDVLTRSIGP